MSLNFLNPVMLLGLIGIALPILAHLISRRRHDVVPWGAMQFLELGRKARRRVRLEQLLLMLLRMGLIALVVLALARPWAQGGFFTRLVSTQSRDVVIVIDGSGSMGWEGRSMTPHAEAVQWVHRFLEELRPGDSATLIDARQRPRVVQAPTRDLRRFREQLDSLPGPDGAANLAEAARRGVQILSRTSHLARDVILITDGQAHGWSAGDEDLWLAFDDLRRQPTVEPRAWIVEVGGGNLAARTNFGLDRLQLSRERTVVDFPVRVRTRVRYDGPHDAPATRRVSFEVNGQRLAEKTLRVQVPPGGQAEVEFQHRFPSAGSHVVSVVLERDHLPFDDRAEAAVVVTDALPVLLVDGDPQVARARSETFFALRALSPPSHAEPWVRANVVSASRFDPEQLQGIEAVVLANVRRLDPQTAAALADFVAQGGGLLVALGDQVDPAWYNETLHDGGTGPLPALLEAVVHDESPDLGGIHVKNSSLELPWLRRFRREQGGDLTEARFGSWWRVGVPEPGRDRGAPRGGAEAAAAGSAAAERATGESAAAETIAAGPGSRASATRSSRNEVRASPVPVVAAALESDDPFLVTARYGRGGVALLTAPLDADWSTLPARYDYVPLLHELLLHLAAQTAARNVDVGEPLHIPLPEGDAVEDYAFFGPGGTEIPAAPAGDELRPAARLDDTSLPGVYTFRRRGAETPARRGEHFVANFDRDESDLTPLDDVERGLLTREGRMAFVESREALQRQMLRDDSRAELWRLLLLVFLAILVGEVVMTRRLVQGGHVVDETGDRMKDEG